MPYAIDLRNLPVEADGVLPESAPVYRDLRRDDGPWTPERQASVDRLYEQNGMVTRPIEREQEAPAEEPPAKEQEDTKKPAKTEKKAVSDKPAQAKQAPAQKEEQLLGSELPTFAQTMEAAKRGEPKALAMLNYTAKMGGFNNGVEFGKDGKAYYKDNEGNLQPVDMETAQTLYDRLATAAIYYNQWRQGRMNQKMPSRQAIATEYDPYVLESLRTRAILQSDPNGLIAYTKMPYDIENTAARTDYARAGIDLRRARGTGQAQQEEWTRMEDNSYLVSDKATGRPLYASDIKGNKAPAEFAGNMPAWEQELKRLSRDLDEGESLHWNERIGYFVVDKAGKPYPLKKYMAEKNAVPNAEPTGTAAKKQTEQTSEPKKEAVKTNLTAYNNIGTARLDDR